jgi:hypothetical protein
MSQNFGTKGFTDGAEYIRPGVQEVTLKDIVSDTNPNGKDYLKFTFFLKGGNPNNTTDFNLYMSTPGGIKMNSKRIKSFGYFWGLEDGKVEMFYISNQTSYQCRKPDLKKAKIILLEKNHTDL